MTYLMGHQLEIKFFFEYFTSFSLKLLLVSLLLLLFMFLITEDTLFFCFR